MFHSYVDPPFLTECLALTSIWIKSTSLHAICGHCKPAPRSSRLFLSMLGTNTYIYLSHLPRYPFATSSYNGVCTRSEPRWPNIKHSPSMCQKQPSSYNHDHPHPHHLNHLLLHPPTKTISSSKPHPRHKDYSTTQPTSTTRLHIPHPQSLSTPQHLK